MAEAAEDGAGEAALRRVFILILAKFLVYFSGPETEGRLAGFPGE